MSLAEFFTRVVTPWKVNATMSPCLDALMPNSLRRSNSPVAASATASIICMRLLPMPAAVLPKLVSLAWVGSRPMAFIFTKASVAWASP